MAEAAVELQLDESEGGLLTVLASGRGATPCVISAKPEADGVGPSRARAGNQKARKPGQRAATLEGVGPEDRPLLGRQPRTLDLGPLSGTRALDEAHNRGPVFGRKDDSGPGRHALHRTGYDLGTIIVMTRMCTVTCDAIKVLTTSP